MNIMAVLESSDWSKRLSEERPIFVLLLFLFFSQYTDIGK